MAYPEGIAKLADPWPPIVAFLFFFMIFTLGLDSQVWTSHNTCIFIYTIALSPDSVRRQKKSLGNFPQKRYFFLYTVCHDGNRYQWSGRCIPPPTEKAQETVHLYSMYDRFCSGNSSSL